MSCTHCKKYEYDCDSQGYKKQCCEGITKVIAYAGEKYLCGYKQEWSCDRKPKCKLAVVTCMDSRLDVPRLLGLCPGDCDIIRNAGGVVTDDVVRSLVVSRELNGTVEILLIGVLDTVQTVYDGNTLASELEDDLCQSPEFLFETFSSAEKKLKEGVMRLLRNPFIKGKECIKAYFYVTCDCTLGDNDYVAGELVPVCLDDLKEKACLHPKEKCKPQPCEYKDTKQCHSSHHYQHDTSCHDF